MSVQGAVEYAATADTPVSLVLNSCVPIENGIVLFLMKSWDFFTRIMILKCKLFYEVPWAGWVLGKICDMSFIIVMIIVLFLMFIYLSTAGDIVGGVTDKLFKPEVHIFDFMKNLWAPMDGMLKKLPGMKGFIGSQGMGPTASTKMSTAICGGLFGLLAMMTMWESKFGSGLVALVAFFVGFAIGSTFIGINFVRIPVGTATGVFAMVLGVSQNWGAAIYAVLSAMLLVRVILPTKVGMMAGSIGAVVMMGVATVCVFTAILPFVPVLLEMWPGTWIITGIKLGLKGACLGSNLGYFG
ncbi:hypothetical protein ACFLQI_02175 [Candidatus Undinarchaeota archaeon]